MFDAVKLFFLMNNLNMLNEHIYEMQNVFQQLER